MAEAIMWFFVAVVFAVTVAIAAVLEVRKRRHKRWLERDRYHAPLPSVAAARKLGIERDDVGLRLRDAVERRIAERQPVDIDAELAVIDEFARKRDWP
jgi:hypothetical protein